ncbi:DUF4349 domain-containing protein [Actinokineospora sp.]|uniref:DUF4349 domain-containing protein n=1 Tax=Actinokineospora sp. TaxID=1872133 RepID=UPI0040378924
MRTYHRRVRLAGLLLLAVAAVGTTAACGSSESSSTAAYDVGAPAVAPQTPGARNGAGDGATSGGSGRDPAATESKAQEVNQPGVDRKLVRTASLDITAPDLLDTAGRARAAVVGAGGYSGQEQVGERNATLTLYVPSDRFDAVLGELERFGKVTSRTQNAQDVTEQVVDVESRVLTQRASLERVRALLGRATGIAEIVQIESEVTRREADLESLLKRREALAGSVAMSTVTLRISLGGPAPAPVEDDDTFLDALAAGWSAFLAAGGFVLRLVGTVLPFAVVLGVPAVLVWRWRRGRPAPVVVRPAE